MTLRELTTTCCVDNFQNEHHKQACNAISPKPRSRLSVAPCKNECFFALFYITKQCLTNSPTTLKVNLQFIIPRYTNSASQEGSIQLFFQSKYVKMKSVQYHNYLIISPTPSYFVVLHSLGQKNFILLSHTGQTDLTLVIMRK